jgi:twinkle protein
MAVHQATGLPALSLPNGAGNLPDVVIPFLDQFKKIILWMDNDAVGKINE